MDSQKITTFDGLETLYQVGGNLFFASQPKLTALSHLPELGIQHVVNIRLNSEGPFEEQAQACEKLNINYHHYPVYESGKWNIVHLHNLNEFIANHKNNKILIHCKSANRVGAWYSLYLIQKQGKTLDQALNVAKQCGLTKKELEQSVREFSELYY